MCEACESGLNYIIPLLGIIAAIILVKIKEKRKAEKMKDKKKGRR